MTREEAKRELLFAKREVMADSWIDKAYDMAIEALAQPEIVRCKDCKKCQIEILCDDYWCDGKKVWKDHFCGYAERKEGEADD